MLHLFQDRGGGASTNFRKDEKKSIFKYRDEEKKIAGITFLQVGAA